MIKKILFVALIWVAANGFSQQSEYILGKVVDATTQEPVVFASIRIKNRALGIISNVDGDFKIPLKYKEYGEVVEISSMGYELMEIDLNDLNPSQLNLFKLKPNIEILDEVILISKKKKALSAKEIVSKAIENIPKNYPQTPFSYVGYYRDYQVKNDIKFNFNEAILEVFDNGFLTNDYLMTNYKLYQYTRNKTFPRDTFGEQPYDNKTKFIPGATIEDRKGNELLILRNMDAFRNYEIDTYSFVHQFNKDFITNHWLRKNNDVSLGEQKFYSIAVSKRNSKYLVFGEMLISKTSFAIHSFDYAVYTRGGNVRSNSTLESLKQEADPLFEVNLGYENYNGQMYPSYISFNNRFIAYGEPRFKLVKLYVDVPDKCVVVKFNNQPDRRDVLKKNKYTLQYGDHLLKVDSIQPNGDSARLYFTQKDWSSYEKIIAADPSYSTTKMTINIKNMKDVDGNLINAPSNVDFKQYREFFTQRINTKASLDNNSNYMRKDRPIFANQIFGKPSNFSDYWMNTPMQRVND